MVTASQESWSTVVPTRAGETHLEVPGEISERTLNREIAVQDLTGRRLTQLIGRLERIAASNLELMVCPEAKLEAIAGELGAVGRDLERFFADFSRSRSAIEELERSRADVRELMRGRLLAEIERAERLRRETFEGDGDNPFGHRGRLERFRKELAKSIGLVGTELKKIFAHLFACDPRNLYRTRGARSQREILFRRFRRDVERTGRLYTAVRRLDTYVRGAIIATDLLPMTAERIVAEGSLACLFETDYALFLNALFDEIGERLIPEIEEVLTLDGIWYDDYESLLKKSKTLIRLTIAFKAAYIERGELREEARSACRQQDGTDPALRRQLESVLGVLDSHGHREVAGRLRNIDQVLVDLEGMLLQWEKGIALRAFADERWRHEDPFERRREGRKSSVVFAQ